MKCSLSIQITRERQIDMKKILVIDDSPFIAKEIEDILREKDYEVIGHARNGESGIDMYKELKPDAVTLDIIMPGIDGIETAGQILKADPEAKIVMLSSLCDYDTLQEIKDIGLKHLVAKPIEADQLIEALEDVLS